MKEQEGSGEPCIWMSAGIVAYKLCNHGFDCESCPFDAALRGAVAERTASAPARSGLGFPDDRRYDRGHGWAQDLGAGRARIGVDPFAAHLLAHCGSVVLPARGEQLEAGHVACWFLDGPASIPIRSPLGGVVVRDNEEVREHLPLVESSPCESGWLFEVESPDLEREMGRLLDSGQIRERAEKQLAQLVAKAASYVSGAHEAVGPTLADGGERILDLRRILGPARYRRLLLPLLR